MHSPPNSNSRVPAPRNKPEQGARAPSGYRCNSNLAIRYRLNSRRRSAKFSTAPIAAPNSRSELDATHRLNELQGVVRQLSQEVRKLETSNRAVHAPQAISTGCLALDQCLPHQGYLPGSIVEYLRTAPASGASYLALAAAASALRGSSGFLVIVDTQHNFYPPALVAHGIDLKKTVFVRPTTAADAMWAIDQALRTQAVSAVIAEVPRMDDRSARRLQLAAEQGAGLGLLLRGAAARHQPSWSEIQWLIRSPVSPSAGRALQVKLLKNRGGHAGAIINLRIDSQTGTIDQRLNSEQHRTRRKDRHEPQIAMRLASELANPASRSRRAAAS